MSTLLSAIGRSLLVSCMIPAIVFITVTVVVFAPEQPTEIFKRLNVVEIDSTQTPPVQKPVEFAAVLALILVISFILAYILMITNWMLVRLYEGYYIPFRSAVRGMERWRKKRLAGKTARLRDELDGLAQDHGPDFHHRKWRGYLDKKSYLAARFPANTDDLLPFRLGNIYRAFEEYSFARYGMDSLFFWPRLVEVIPENYMAKITGQNNIIAFLLNLSLFAALIALEAFISLKVITVDLQSLGSLIATRTLNLQALDQVFDINSPSLPQGIMMLSCLILSYTLYHAATSAALTYGHYIRNCYDLFRLDLLESLHIDPLDELGGEEERKLWRSIHRFLVLEEDSPSPYKRRELDTSPGTLICTAGQLIQTCAQLIFWSSLKRSIEWIVPCTCNTRTNTPRLSR